MIDIVGATIGRLFCMVAKKIKQPPLRHCVTPLLKERLVWLLSWGAVNNVDCGVALSVSF